MDRFFLALQGLMLRLGYPRISRDNTNQICAVHANPYSAQHQVVSGIEPIQSHPHFVVHSSCRSVPNWKPWPLLQKC